MAISFFVTYSSGREKKKNLHIVSENEKLGF